MGKFWFICGDDDFLVENQGKARFREMSAGVSDSCSLEIIDGAVANLESLENAIEVFLAAVQTQSLFGDQKAVWLKNLNVLSDSKTGKSEGAKALVERLLSALSKSEFPSVSILITACPIDRRRREYKWFEQNSTFEEIKSVTEPESLAAMAERHAQEHGTRLLGGASRALVELVGGNTRLILQEVIKLATWKGPQAAEGIGEADVLAMVPRFGEADFFEPAEAFFQGDLHRTLEALGRYFFTNDESRPLLVNLQNKGRLLIQIRALADAGQVKASGTVLPKGALESAWAACSRHYAAKESKSSFNVFSQNPWYVGNKLAPDALRFPLKRLLEFQMEFAEAFRDLVRRPAEQESVMRDLAIRCLR